MYQSNGKTVIASVTLTKRLPNRHSITATAQLVHLHGNAKPYFSVTGELRNLRRKEENQIEMCGAMHAEIANCFPELAPLIALHLSDDDGTPMHAAANGAYFLGFTSYQPENAPDFATFAKLWRVTEADARDIHRVASGDANPVGYVEMMAGKQVDRWAAEAMYGADLIVNLARLVSLVTLT